MRGSIVFWCFLLALPSIGVLGHDVYHAVNSKQGIDLSHPFPFSDFGWLIVTYAHDFYDWLHSSVDPGVWTKIIVPLFKTKSIIVTAVPALAVYVLLGVLRLIGVGPFAGSGLVGAVQSKTKVKKSRQRAAIALPDIDAPKERVKYKRK